MCVGVDHKPSSAMNKCPGAKRLPTDVFFFLFVFIYGPTAAFLNPESETATSNQNAKWTQFPLPPGGPFALAFSASCAIAFHFSAVNLSADGTGALGLIHGLCGGGVYTFHHTETG